MAPNPRHFRPWPEFAAELMANPEVKEAYDQLEVPFQIAEDLIKLRLASGLTQKEFAQKINTHQPEIARLESGTRNLTVGRLQEIAEATGAKLTISLRLPSRSRR